MHPADEIRGIKSKKLSTKRIVLGVTGSIAAVESIRLAREFIRHGADVTPVMTKSATRIIHPDSLEFATGNKPIIELTGKTEHVALCGQVKDPVDLVLISPCTANTISKIAYGIDDTSVTTFVSTAIGSHIPILIVPAMHISMYNHKVLQENIKRCKTMGISVIGPALVGTKAKMADQHEIVESVIRTLGKRDLVKKKILVIGGATAEPIDDVRILTNRSSGKTAVALANNAFERGAQVELWYGYAKEQTPPYLPVKKFETVADLVNLVKTSNVQQYTSIILCAAIADYLPKRHKGKIPSGTKKLVLELSPAPKVIHHIKSKAPKAQLIAFKVEQSKNTVHGKAYDLLKKYDLDVVIGNTVSVIGKDESEIWIIDKKGKSTHKKGTKEELAGYILDVL
jgi:phosphopantothenoylcysteine decarboxylase/phosphopantothenate--cysteine ligase